MSERTVAIVLAAGQGSRMKSALPKVLHPLAGRPMLSYPIDAALEAGVDEVLVVVGHARAEVEAALAARYGDAVRTAHQPEQRGTGDAVRCAMAALGGRATRALILYGDSPLITAPTLATLLEASRGARLALVTTQLPTPKGYGRILRDAAGAVVGIREERDCSEAERALCEVNPGVYAVEAAFLEGALARLSTDNAQGELYLTDVVAMAAAEGGVRATAGDIEELRGVNDRAELAEQRARLFARIARAHAARGVDLEALDTVYIDADCELEPGCAIAPGVHLRGRCVVREGARVDVGAVLREVEVEAGAEILPYTVASRSRVGAGAQVGPFAHLRPETELGPKSKVGNFSETKKTRLGARSKVNHLSYVGDGVIGEDVNIGAGTIFCNYDGVKKHTTVLEDGVFIGSDSQLVAPVTVGAGAYVGSGTTVTSDVPPDALAVGRAKQRNLPGYAAKLRAKLRK